MNALCEFYLEIDSGHPYYAALKKKKHFLKKEDNM